MQSRKRFQMQFQMQFLVAALVCKRLDEPYLVERHTSKNRHYSLCHLVESCIDLVAGTVVDKKVADAGHMIVSKIVDAGSGADAIVVTLLYTKAQILGLLQHWFGNQL